MKLDDLEVYNLSREISKNAWEIYNPLDWQVRKIFGDQFVRRETVFLHVLFAVGVML